MATKPAYLDEHAPSKEWGLYYDPIYKYIPLRPIFRQALDIPLVQRLRGIKQLSTVELVFPGATHNRFQHSVGVYHLASLAWSVLQEQQTTEGPAGWPDLTKGMRMGLQLAALFHDVGHGPYSHIFDIFCRRAGLKDELGHQALTRSLILGEIGDHTDIADFLAYVHSKHKHLPGAEFLRPENVAAIATGEVPPDHPECLFLPQIVASTFDVDRMDYLMRDSLHLGIDLGADPWEVLHAYTLAPWGPEDEPGADGAATTGDEVPWGLAIRLHAAVAAEGLLAARDQAYRRVYYHSTHRIDQEMLILAMWEYTGGQSPWELWDHTDDGLLRKFEDREGTFPADIARRIRERRLYEPLPYEISVAGDLDEIARHAWLRFNSQARGDIYQDLVDAAKELAQVAGFDEKRDRIIFDLERIPLSKAEDYQHKWLWDSSVNKRKSLLEVCPHLELMHRVDVLAGKERSMHQDYIEAASRLILSLPLVSLRAKLRATIEAVRSVGKELDPAGIADQLYAEIMEPVVERLFERILPFEEEQAEQSLRSKMANAGLGLVRGLVEQELG